MVSRKVVLPTLLLVFVAGLGVSAQAAQTQSSAAKKKTSASSSGVHKSTSKKGKKSSRRQPGQKTPTADRISEIQSALARDGSYAGAPNGKWDDSTVEAMKKYQAAHGLNPSGKLDALTLQKLGLGSQTAGAAAPTPPMGSTSRLTSSNSSRSASRQQ
jgi:peptidoglycan hydrolase-like protein with peptidoglycan-binding domain